MKPQEKNTSNAQHETEKTASSSVSQILPEADGTASLAHPKKRASKALDMVCIALFAVIIAACSWISVPGAVPFTLQTFGVFCAVGFLGGRRGTIAILLYILLGAVGLPVFSNFTGGIGALAGATGGYIVGFLFMGLIYWLITALCGEKWWSMLLGMILGMAVCYAFGTAWFTVVYTHTKGAMTFLSAMGICVIPFLWADAAKLALAFVLIRMLKKRIPIFASDRRN